MRGRTWIWLGGAAVVLFAAVLGAVELVSGEDSPGRYEVPGPDMEPTLAEGEVVAFGPYEDEEPQVGDIVIFFAPAGVAQGAASVCGAPPPPGSACPEPEETASEQMFIKRIVALPGDEVSISGGEVVRNGEPAQEEFTAPCEGGADCNLPRSVILPPEHYFLLGDNRGASVDSRNFGPIPLEWIAGRVFE